MTQKLLVTLAASALLFGCGEDGSQLPPAGDIDPAVDEIAFMGDLAVAGKQSVAVIGYIDNVSRVGLHFQWEQVTGPPVIMANNRGSVLAFDMPETESVSFRLTVSDVEGDSISGVVELNPEGIHDGAFVRRDHEVIEGNDVSVRLSRDHALAHIMAANPGFTEDDAHAQLNDDATPRFIEWRQVDGPLVEYDDSNPERILFTAPIVDRDTVLTFEVTETMDSLTYSDRVHVYVDEDPLVVDPDQPIAGLVHAYRPDSPWRDAVEECVYSQVVMTVALCPRERLPLLGQSSATGVPTVEEVLDRVVVSHDWMGVRFEEFLRTRDPDGDFRRLLSSVSAVVLSYDVRPSFYSGATAAIYIDPRYVWLLPEERDTLNEAPDYRSAFGADLQFYVLWRYVKDDDYAYSSVSSYRRAERTWDDAGYSFARLMFHELAHATDYFPPSVHDSMTGETYADAYNERQGNLISDQLFELYPLTSVEMYGLALVQFRGLDADEVQAAYGPDDVAGFFAPDLATEFYAYNTVREDLAMVFEEVMMTYRHGIQRDIAITDRPEMPTADTVMVSWGQRGRVADPALADRVAFTIDEILPALDGQEVVGGIPAPWAMRPGESWAANLVSDPEGMMLAPPAVVQQASERPLALDLQRDDHLHLHRAFPAR